MHQAGAASSTVDYIVIAGGGAGGNGGNQNTYNAGSGGGGAGGYITGTFTVNGTGNISVTVGSGSYNTSFGQNNGSNSV